MRHARTITAILLLAGATCPASARQVDAALAQEINATLPAHCQAHLSKLAAYQCQVESEFRNPATGEVLEKSTREMKQHGFCNLLSETFSLSKRKHDQLTAINSQYSFRLDRGGKGWFLKEIKVNQSVRDAVIPFNLLPDSDYALRGMSPYNVYTHWLPDLLTDKNTVTLLAPVRGDGSRLVKLGFDHRPQKRRASAASPSARLGAPVPGSGLGC